MHTKKIEIDGFKCYAQKKTLERYDEQFNAITGLNGSGKSTILDSICFVLGITDLKCIRAENMNALVYKSGQAGITKASVTITFDNRDKKSGPLGYQEYDETIVRREIIVNGRASYTINGSVMTNSERRPQCLRPLEVERFIADISDRKELEKKKEELRKTEASLGGEEEQGNKAEESVKAAKAVLKALAMGLTTEDNGQAVALDHTAAMFRRKAFLHWYTGEGMDESSPKPEQHERSGLRVPAVPGSGCRGARRTGRRVLRAGGRGVIPYGGQP